MNTEGRKYFLLIFIVSTFVIFIFRLAYMQVYDESWKKQAKKIIEQKQTIFPARGIVFDRNGKKLIVNETYYDLMFKEKNIKNLDTIAFAKMLGISVNNVKETFENIRKKHNRGKEIYLPYLAYPFITEITKEKMAIIAPKLYQFPGFYEVPKILRKYPSKNGANIFGYISGVWKEDLDKDEFYHRLDNIGRTGIEKYYEKKLRGKKGVKYNIQTAGGTKKGSYKQGKIDTNAIAGKNLHLTIDVDFQNYGELLLKNKRGCVIAIEPKTGEVLAMISSPSFDPNMFVGEKKRRKNYNQLYRDSLKPLFSRPLSAQYSPGSILKLVQGLIGLQEGVVNTHTYYPCNKELFGCHNHGIANSIDKAIQFSCNPYFYFLMRNIVQQGKEKNIFKDAPIGLDVWAKYMNSFGLGIKPKIDISGARKGNIPDSKYYDRWYKKGRWAFSTIKSNAIGQGEVLVTPLQMANLAAIIANRGYYYEPHLVKKIENDKIDSIFTVKKYTLVNSEHFLPIIEGMRKVVNENGGTAKSSKLQDIIMCGKTGTVENFAIVNGKRIQLTDHSVFIAFAPMINPKIAIAVYVENAGYGGTWAAPISSLMIEKYLKGKISDIKKEKRILNTNLLYSR